MSELNLWRELERLRRDVEELKTIDRPFTLQTVFASITAQVVINSAVLVDVTNLVGVITTRAGTKLLIVVSVPIYVDTAAKSAGVDLKIDATDNISGVAFGFGSIYDGGHDNSSVIAFSYLQTGLAAGAHTVQVRALSEAGSIATICGGSLRMATLTLIELPA